MYRIVVFPSCNEPGLEIVHALIKSNKVHLFGGSSYEVEFDPSRMILRNHLFCPKLDSPDFREEFKRLLMEHGIDTVFPATDGLVEEFSRWQVEGVTFITTNPDTARLVSSKSRVYERLAGLLPVPEIYTADTVVFPAYAKPDVGAGSHGHRIVRNSQECDAAIRDGLLLTEYLPGEEFTVDCINDLQGRLLFCGPRLRGQIGRGIALGTKTLPYPRIEGYVRTITERIRIEGPWFAQFKISRSGQPTLMEINARVGGSMTLTRLAGVNIPLLALFLYKGFRVEVPSSVSGTVLNRCLKNYIEGPNVSCVLWDLDDTLLRKDGKPDPEAMASLYDCHNRGIKQLLLTKNPNVHALLTTHAIPLFFDEVVYSENKLPAVQLLLNRHGIGVEDCVAVNDSNTEKLALQRMLPGLRVIGPDAFEVLGREKSQ
jgi:carbamoyl-phosphate synthase large subunit